MASFENMTVKPTAHGWFPLKPGSIPPSDQLVWLVSRKPDMWVGTVIGVVTYIEHPDQRIWAPTADFNQLLFLTTVADGLIVSEDGKHSATTLTTPAIVGAIAWASIPNPYDALRTFSPEDDPKPYNPWKGTHISMDPEV